MKSTLVSDFEFSDGVLKVAGTGYGHGVDKPMGCLSNGERWQFTGRDCQTFFKDIEIQKLYD